MKKSLIIIVLITLVCSMISAQVQPSVMVVPFKKSTENFQDLLENDRSKRIAVAKLDEFFLSREFRTINFLAQMQNKLYDSQLAYANSKTVEQAIAEKNNADIIAYIDTDYINYMAHGERTYQVNLTITAIDVQSAQILSSVEGKSKAGSFNDEEFYIKDAISRIADSFLTGFDRQLKKNREEGVPMRLSLSIAMGCNLTFFDEVGEDFETLMDVVEAFLRENAHNNYLRCPIKVDTKYECEDYRIPLMHPSDPNRTYTSTDFYRAFNKYLRKNYGLYSKPTFIGTGLRITICGKTKCESQDLLSMCSNKMDLAKEAANANNFGKAFQIIEPYLNENDTECSKAAYRCIKSIFEDHANYLCKSLFTEIQSAIHLGQTKKAAKLINSAEMLSVCYEKYEDDIKKLVNGLNSSDEVEQLRGQIDDLKSQPFTTAIRSFMQHNFSL